MRTIIVAAAAAIAISFVGGSGVSAVPINAATIKSANVDSVVMIGYYYYRNGHRYYYSGPGRRSCPDWKRDSGSC
jgi:hypothetical protein